MHRNTVSKIGLVVTLLFAVTLMLFGAYYLGSNNQAQTIESLKIEQIERDKSYAKSLDTITVERNRTLNDYDAACMEYQKLYTAYDELYSASKPTSNTPRYSSPDSARGNEDSCYR